MLKKKVLGVVIVVAFLGVGCNKTKDTQPNNLTPSTTSTSTSSPANEKVVYLTFDADMTPVMAKKLKDNEVASWYSPGLIQYLQDNQIAATFFVTGMFAEIYPDAIKQWAQNKNFAIENHSYDHPGFEDPCYGLATISTDQEKISQMQKTQDILKELTGTTPAYFRHPGLCHNQHDDDLAAKLNLKISDEGLASGDAFNKNTEAIVNNVVKNSKAGTVIILHTGGPNAPATEAAIKKIVPKLQAEGFFFAKL